MRSSPYAAQWTNHAAVQPGPPPASPQQASRVAVPLDRPPAPRVEPCPAALYQSGAPLVRLRLLRVRARRLQTTAHWSLRGGLRCQCPVQDPNVDGRCATVAGAPWQNPQTPATTVAPHLRSSPQHATTLAAARCPRSQHSRSAAVTRASPQCPPLQHLSSAAHQAAPPTLGLASLRRASRAGPPATCLSTRTLRHRAVRQFLRG